MSRILLVDDDIAEISAVKRVLSRGGHQPLLATNASDALAVLQHDAPQLVVLSATCDGGEALAFAARLADDPATAQVPVVVLGDGGTAPAGARRLRRPIDPELLQAEVAAALGPASTIALPPPPAGPPVPTGAKPAATPVGRVPLVRAEKPSRPALDGASASALAAAAEDRDPAAARRAAADALRARAAELRRGNAPAKAAAAPAPAAAPPGVPAPPPKGVASPAAPPAAATARAAGRPRPTARPPDAPPTAASPPDRLPARAPAAVTPDGDEDGLEAFFRAASSEPAAPAPFELAPPEPAPESDRGAAVALADAPRSSVEDARRAAAEEALRALEEEASAHAVATSRRAREAQRKPAGEAARGDVALEGGRRAAGGRARLEADEVARRAALEEARRALDASTAGDAAQPSGADDASARGGALEAARREAFEEARRELEERARAEAAEAARLVQAEARARQEAVQAARREAEELGRREAEEKKRARQAEARAAAEAEARRRVEEELAALRQQLQSERQAAEARLTTVMERAAAEEEAADTLRRLAEDEARQRAEAEARARDEEEEKLRASIASARSEMEALRRRGEEEARRRAEAEDALRRYTVEAPLPGPGATFTPPPFFAPFEGDEAVAPVAVAVPPPPDPAEEAARRRVAALRIGAPVESTAPEPEPTPARDRPWSAPSLPDPEAPPDPHEPGRPLPPPSPELRAGTLAELPAPRLLALGARRRITGRIDFQGDAARSLWFEDGKVVGAASADPAERVEELALRLGLITRDQHRVVAQAAAALPSRRAALLLLERGFVKPTELTGLVRRRTEEVVFGVFADPDGRFRWAASEVPPEERIALDRGTAALAVEGVRRRWLAPRVDALLGGAGTLLAPVPGAPPPADLGLSPEERRAVALADGLRTLDEIVQASPLDPLTTRQVLAALVLVDALAVRLLQAGRAQGATAAAIDLARVRDKLDQVRRADYFTVLGVGRLCTPHEVREASDRLAAEFDPRRYADVREEGLPGKLAEILQVIRDARDVLADDRLRQEYLRGLGD